MGNDTKRIQKEFQLLKDLFNMGFILIFII